MESKKEPNNVKPEQKLEDKLSEVLTTDKQKAFLQNRLAGMNKRESAIKAGYSESCASVMATRITNRLEANTAFIEEMQDQGLTIDAIVKEIKRGMTESMHPQHPDQPDNYNRRAFADMAIKLYGGYAPSKVNVDIDKTVKKEVHMVSVDVLLRAEELLGEKLLTEEQRKEAKELRAQNYPYYVKTSE